MRVRRRGRECLALAAVALAAFATPARARDDFPRYWAVVLGVDKYRDERLAPVSGRRDVVGLVSELRRSARFRIRSDAAAADTRDSVVRYLVDVAHEIGPNDTFLLYFAGHGVLDTFSHQPFWLLRGTHLDTLEVEGLRLAHLVDYVSIIPAKHRLIVLDHCLAGQILGVLGAGGKYDESLHAIEDEDASPRGVPPGLVVLGAAASVAKQTTNGGVFTDVLLEALQADCTGGQPCADTNHDGKLSFEELRAYVKQRFDAMAAQDPSTQRPIFFVPQGASDFTVLDLTKTPEEQTRFYQALKAVVDDLENGEGRLGKDEAAQARAALQTWQTAIATPGLTLDDSGPTVAIVRAVAEVANADLDTDTPLLPTEKAEIIRKALTPGATP